MDELRNMRQERDMRRLEDPDGSASSLSAILASTARLAATSIGIVAILIGLYCSTKVFFGIYDILKAPKGFEATYQQWVEVIGAERVNVEIEGKPFPMANVLAVAVLGAGVFVLAWVAIGIMLTGAKIVSWTSSEKEAIKRILKYTFGSDKARAPSRRHSGLG